MVGARFAEELERCDTERAFEVVMIGSEPYEPYNRVLLSDVLSGRTDVAAIALPLPAGGRTRLQRGLPAVAVDRASRYVVTGDGAHHPYDVLVLATGAQAHVPNLVGLGRAAGTHRLPHGVHVLRTVDDCRDIVAATVNARTAAVVGGGLLGLEAACGLRARGLAVTVLHRGDWLLDGLLGRAAATVLGDCAHDLGLAVELAAHSTALETTAGRVHAVRLADGRVVPADLVLLACGAVPDTALASAAGLTTGRGVVVDDRLASPDDPSVFSIGDCAEPAGGCTGLLAPGWEQARQLARQLVGRTPSAAVDTTRARGQVVRLKADGLDVVTMGAAADPQARTVTLADPMGRRHLEVSVQDGRVIAATCVGAGAVAADLMVAFSRATAAPLDPAALLVSGARPGPPVEAASPTRMPAGATVCRCNGVTKADVLAAWEGGACRIEEVASCTRAGTGCGSCQPVVQGLLDWLADAEPDTPRRPTPLPPVTSQPAGGRREANVAPG